MSVEMIQSEFVQPVRQEARFDQSKALCATPGVDPDIFFSDDPAKIDQARQVCASCVVRQACLEGAIERREPEGVWGGEIFSHSRIVQGLMPQRRNKRSK